MRTFIGMDENANQYSCRRSNVTALLPIMGAVFVAFLVIGMAMPVLPLHVHQTLGLSTFIVGLVAGTQFAAAILSRVWAGRYADASGAKRAVIAGLLVAAMSGLVSRRCASLPTPRSRRPFYCSAVRCSVSAKASS